MKKNYLKPEIFSLNVFCDAMLAQSHGGAGGTIKPGTGAEEEGGFNANKNRGEWGNVWAN